MKNITTEKTRLTFADCDYKKRLKISSMLRIMAEIAGFDYENKGLGHQRLWDEGFVFLLSRISLHIEKYPKDQETITTSTWENGKKGPMFIRAYSIESDRLCIDCKSGWILVNPETRRIYKPSQFPYQFEQRLGVDLLASDVGKIEHGTESVGSYKVALCDLDANGHTYNARYADIAMNAMEMCEFERDIENFRINFVSEAKFGDEISLLKSSDESKTLVTGMVGEKVCFETEFLYKI